MTAESEPSPGWIQVCAWCGISLPERETRPSPPVDTPNTTHGICPSCRDEFVRALVAEWAAARPANPSAGEAA